MINVVLTYNNVSDRVKPFQNGYLSIEEFNRKSRLAEIDLMDWLTGKFTLELPQPYTNQKNRDWLIPFLAKHSAQVIDGELLIPENYVQYETSYVIGSFKSMDDCDNDVIVKKGNTPITLMDNQVFDKRCRTYVKNDRPSIKNPISKIIGRNIYHNPEDLGSVSLEYIRMPVFASIKVKVDALYNDEVPDELNSINYEWPEAVSNHLIYFIARQYSASNRENALTQQNELLKK